MWLYDVMLETSVKEWLQGGRLLQHRQHYLKESNKLRFLASPAVSAGLTPHDTQAGSVNSGHCRTVPCTVSAWLIAQPPPGVLND